MTVDRRLVAAVLAGAALPFPVNARSAMQRKIIEPQAGSYAQAVEVTGPSRFLFVSGQVPEDGAGHVPANFPDQARLAWKNVEAKLAAGGMGLDDLVKVTMYLSDRRYREDNYKVRNEILGQRKPALTVIICGIYDEAWLLEIEAIAAA